MLLLAILFLALTMLGALVGLGDVGHPIHDQSVCNYGWALCLNAGVIGGFLLHVRHRRARLSQPRR